MVINPTPESIEKLARSSSQYLEKYVAAFIDFPGILFTHFFFIYVVGCWGASQLGDPWEGARQGYKANKLKSH